MAGVSLYKPKSYEFPLLCSSRRQNSPRNRFPVMLKQADGSYACIAESANRFSLGEAKEELLRVLGLQEEERSSLEFLRRGYKASTWWEEDFDSEVSYGWRS
ncbi:hypothetical protein JHK82_017328 [Glycine max]|nr:hypothetical protein JHK87_017271 [Glycine soja]KAG5141633.1 hypothetical protein JHK82_017328 [Glycine max]